jgi:hypothetical protein
MSNLHSEQDDPHIHNPKGFTAASTGFKAWKNERDSWAFEASQTLPTVLGVVNNTAAPPTEVDGDIYILDNTGSSHANWDGSPANSWVRFSSADGVWESIVPASGTICYSSGALQSYVFNGTIWSAIGGGGVTTFVGLSDTPANYTGAGNRFVRVNAGATALEFVAANSIGLSAFNNDAGFVTSSSNFANTNLTLTANRSHALGGFTLGFTGGDTGFGTASPTARLHVVGSDDLSGTYAAKIGGATTNGLWVKNNGVVYANVNLGVGIENTSARFQVQGYSDDASSVAMRVGGATTLGYSVIGTGQVLIGSTTAPGSRKMYLESSATAEYFVVTRSAATRAYIGFDNTAGGTLALFDNTTTVVVSLNSDSYSDFINTGKSFGMGTTSPSASAALDITSTTKGVLLPRMTATQASAITGVNGLVLYVTDTNGTFTSVGVWAYENGTWVKL